MSEDEGGDVVEFREQHPRRARTRRSDTKGFHGGMERVVESVWTRMITRGSMVGGTILLSVLGFLAVDKLDQFQKGQDQLHDEQVKLNDKIEGIESGLDDKMADVIANQAAGLADRNAQSGQIADLKAKVDDVKSDLTKQVDDVKSDLTKQVDALGTRLSNIGSKLFDMKGSGDH